MICLVMCWWIIQLVWFVRILIAIVRIDVREIGSVRGRMGMKGNLVIGLGRGLASRRSHSGMMSYLAFGRQILVFVQQSQIYYSYNHPNIKQNPQSPTIHQPSISSQILIKIAQIIISQKKQQQKYLQNPILPCMTSTIHKHDPYNQFSQPSDIPTKLINEIENGTLVIPQQKRQLKIKQMQSQSVGELNVDESNRRMLMDQIRASKDKTIVELRELELKEKELKEAIRRMNGTQRRKKMEKSQFTEQEKQRIKSIIKNTKIGQQVKKKKHEIILQSFTNYLKKQREEQQQLVQKLRQQHKKAVQQNLVTLQKRKKIREQSNKQVNRRMLELRQKKYIHIAKQKQDEQQRQKEQQMMENKLTRIKQRFKLDFQEIIQHQKKYQEIAERKSEERKERFKTQNAKMSTSRKYSTNIFLKMLEEEEKEKKMQEIRKLNRAKQLRSKMQQYKQIVKQKYMPRLTQSKSRQKNQLSNSKSPQRKAQALSHKQIIQKGNQYLKQAKKLRKQKDDPRMITEPQIVKYANYLKTMQKKAKRSGTVQQFRSIVSKDNSLDYSSAYKAKNLAEQIQAKSKKTKDDKLIQSLQNKIDLLRVLL